MRKIIVSDLVKEYGASDNKVMANDRLSFEIEEGEFVVILGPSGAGKSTLLHILGGMDSATSGSVNIFGKEIVGLDEKDLTEYRRQDIGFVFQFYNLIPNLSVLENVELANQIVKKSKDALEILKLVGLENRVNNFPSHISGGEQQRVAIARAIAKNPKILLCDEPTGALDYKTSKDILSLLQRINKEYETTIILATHNEEITKMSNITIRLKDGIICQEIENDKVMDAQELEW